MPVALWIVGPPGVGKTTLARQLLGRVEGLVPAPKLTLAEHGVAAGHYTGGTFDGADTVPYNGAAQVIEAWRALYVRRPLFLLDGDRFSDRTSKASVALARADLRCLLLEADAETLAARRAARGAQQNATWAAGRATKARNFYEGFQPEQRRALAATDPDLAAKVRAWISLAP